MAQALKAPDFRSQEWGQARRPDRMLKGQADPPSARLPSAKTPEHSTPLTKGRECPGPGAGDRAIGSKYRSSEREGWWGQGAGSA